MQSGIRFIPTRMGNSSQIQINRQRTPVHPHAYGELSTMQPFATIYVGSSPRVWGTPMIILLSLRWWRFIPTRMGNSVEKCIRLFDKPVHPHAYGELAMIKTLCYFSYGSSPRVWGTHSISATVPSINRFIPTRMGNSFEPTSVKAALSVHPHAYGELWILSGVGVHEYGSSPRVWGTHTNNPEVEEGNRFIPTRMGNSWATSQASRSPPVHPHAYGELREHPDIHRHGSGSSPRVWGTLCIFYPTNKEKGFCLLDINNLQLFCTYF